MVFGGVAGAAGLGRESAEVCEAERVRGSMLGRPVCCSHLARSRRAIGRGAAAVQASPMRWPSGWQRPAGSMARRQSQAPCQRRPEVHRRCRRCRRCRRHRRRRRAACAGGATLPQRPRVGECGIQGFIRGTRCMPKSIVASELQHAGRRPLASGALLSALSYFRPPPRPPTFRHPADDHASHRPGRVYDPWGGRPARAPSGGCDARVVQRGGAELRCPGACKIWRLPTRGEAQVRAAAHEHAVAIGLYPPSRTRARGTRQPPLLPHPPRCSWRGS